MSALGKTSYILIGIGIGIFASSYVLEHEFNKPIGDIEEYIPLTDRDIDDTKDTWKDSEASNKCDIWSSRGREEDISQEDKGGREGADGERASGSHAEFESSQADLYHFYSSAEGNIYDKKHGRDAKADSKRLRKKADARREEFEKMRAEESANLKKRYSKMYRGGDKQNETSSVDDILHVVSANTDTRESWNDVNADSPDDDEPEFVPDWERDIHDEYVLERIEDRFEIFLDDNPQDFVTLTYYKGDYTLCDDCEQIIPNAEEVVGMAALNRLIEGGPGVFNNVIFVHNLETGINYEVVLAEGMYKETVAGMFDEKMSRR